MDFKLGHYHLLLKHFQLGFGRDAVPPVSER